MSKTSILLLGPTGYLGSSVLSQLLAHPRRNTFEITVLVRSEEKARKLKTFGVNPVIGSIKDTALVEQLAEQAHVLFNIADSDDLAATNAFLSGFKKRHTKTGDVPILIHTSGTGVFMFAAPNTGLATTDRIFRDDDPEDIDRFTPESALHRNVDLVVLKADEEGYVKTHIVMPSTIWGVASNPIVDAGIANRFSIQVPAMIKAALGRGQAGVVGKGQALWTAVNVNEQAEFYVKLYDAILANPSAVGHGHNGYYFGENGEYSWYDLAKAIGKSLVRRGISKSDEPTTFDKEELSKYFWAEEIAGIWGSNARVKSPHSRSIGWQPKLTTQDFLANIDTEVGEIIRQQELSSPQFVSTLSKTPILLLGPTGYLGSSVLSRLLAHPQKDTFEITVLVRSEEKAKKLETFGVKPVIGSIKDTALVERLAEEAHVLFNIADSDDLDATNAFLSGFKKRHAKTGDIPILIHTSGTGIFMWAGPTNGLSSTNRVFSDDDPKEIDASTPDSALHRNVDLVVLKADEEGYVKSHIVLPSTIWGVASNPIVDAGIANRHSIQVPAMIKAALGRSRAGVVGKGKGVWTGINVNEQAEFYVTLFDSILTNPSAVGHGHNGYYFGENGEYTWYDLAKAIGAALVKRGIAKSDEPTTFAKEELSKYFWTEEIAGIWGSNARVKSPHARSLGWVPKLTTKDLLASVDAEVEVFIRQQKESQSESTFDGEGEKVKSKRRSGSWLTKVLRRLRH